MAINVEESATPSMEVPYPPSWIDRLIVWIDRLPAPTWLFYVLGTLAFAFFGNVLFWIDGSLPFGSIDQFVTIFAILVLYWLALYHYLTRVGSQSLKTFRPLLAVVDSELDRIDYELATLPRRLGWMAIPLGIAVAAATILGDPAPFGDLVPQTAVPYIGDTVITGFLVSSFFCLIIRSIRQLMMVRRLHARATDINLLNLDPAHAFSALTARTGIGMILLLVIGFLMDPTEFGSTVDIVDIVLTSTILVMAIAIFVLPVIGIRDQLEEEKQRVLDYTSSLLQATSDRFNRRVEQGDYRDLEGMETAITTLIRERELFARISTWPWDAGTVRGFASTLLLPIFLLLVSQLLERIV